MRYLTNEEITEARSKLMKLKNMIGSNTADQIIDDLLSTIYKPFVLSIYQEHDKKWNVIAESTDYNELKEVIEVLYKKPNKPLIIQWKIE